MTNEEIIKRLESIASAELVCDGLKVGAITKECFESIQETARLAIAALERDRWVSASIPPNTERNVFICYGSPNFKAPCIGHYDHTMKRFYEDKNWFASPIYDAMYWCEMPRLPFPEPPKEEP